MKDFIFKIVKLIKHQKTKFYDNWRLWYISVLCSILVLYPLFVSDGQSWNYSSKSNIELPTIYKIHGIDVSWHNGLINWDKINEDRDENELINFVFIKATEGSDLVDINFKQNWENSKKHGFKRGSYHFFNAVSDPKLQALNYIINTVHEKGDMYPVLDFEVQISNETQLNEAAKNAKIWLETVEKELGVKPIIYTNKPLYRKFLNAYFCDYPIWISDYVSKNLNDIQADNLLLWQHSDAGKVAGINGNVDFNVFLGSPQKFENYIVLK